MQDKKTNSGIIRLSDSQKILRACSVIIPLCFFAFFLTMLLVSVANDMYAFVKPDKTCVVTIDETQTVYERAKSLEDAEVLNNPAVFALYVRSKGAEERVLTFEGELTLNSNMSYREILKQFPKM